MDGSKRVVLRTVEADGKRHEVTVDSNGVERLGPELARCDVTFLCHNGGLRTDLREPCLKPATAMNTRFVNVKAIR